MRETWNRCLIACSIELCDKMATTRKEELENLLKHLGSTQGLEGAAVVAKDGLLVASDLKANVNLDTFAAMSAAMFGAAETALQEMNKGAIEVVITETSQSRLIALNSYQDGILVAMVQGNANLGPVLQELKRAADETRRIMG
jgi:predicted regulator of Ras-like GTPase activity (Roadblock/LC7/MglB family)